MIHLKVTCDWYFFYKFSLKLAIGVERNDGIRLIYKKLTYIYFWGKKVISSNFT